MGEEVQGPDKWQSEKGEGERTKERKDTGRGNYRELFRYIEKKFRFISGHTERKIKTIKGMWKENNGIGWRWKRFRFYKY